MRQPYRRLEAVFERIRVFIDRHSGWSGLAVAFLLGLIVNAAYDTSTEDLPSLLDRLFNVSTYSLAWLSWLAVLIAFTFAYGDRLLARVLRGSRIEDRLARMYEDRVDDAIKPYRRGRMAWATALTLQSCPDLQRGWTPESLVIDREPARFALRSDAQAGYGEYMSDVFWEKYTDDSSGRLMLRESSAAFSDAPILRLRLQPVLWSQVRYYQTCVWLDSAHELERESCLRSAALELKFVSPNSLSLHLVVATSDGYVLITQRSDLVDYYAGSWACSIDEQIDASDFAPGIECPARHWAERALWEELGIGTNQYDSSNVRFLALILEGDSVNSALISFVTLNMDRRTLDSTLNAMPRTDDEFQDWAFIHWKQIPLELVQPSRTYHPASGLRMLYGGMHYVGPSVFVEQLVKAEQQGR